MRQTVLFPGSGAGSMSNSKITRSTSGRGGAVGTSTPGIPIIPTAEDAAANSVPFTGHAERGTDAEATAIPASFRAEGTTTISSDDIPALTLGEAIREKLQGGESDERDWQRRWRQLRRRSTMQIVTRAVAMMMMMTIARLEPMDKDCGSDGGAIGTGGGPGSIPA
jgi:hypothetical protein